VHGQHFVVALHNFYEGTNRFLEFKGAKHPKSLFHFSPFNDGNRTPFLPTRPFIAALRSQHPILDRVGICLCSRDIGHLRRDMDSRQHHKQKDGYKREGSLFVVCAMYELNPRHQPRANRSSLLTRNNARRVHPLLLRRILRSYPGRNRWQHSPLCTIVEGIRPE